MILNLILIVYGLGWLYTSFIFWRYGFRNGGGTFYPIPVAAIIALFWPAIFTLALFREESPDA